MKIELPGLAAVQAPLPVPADRGTKSPSPVGAPSTPATADVAADRTTFSSADTSSASVASLVAQALATPAVRQGRIDAIRQSIDSGEYRIDADKIASAILGKSV